VKVVYRYTQGSVSGSYHLPSSGGSDELGLLEHIQDYGAIALTRVRVPESVKLIAAVGAIAFYELKSILEDTLEIDRNNYATSLVDGSTIAANTVR
jgi:hypothetical protein